MIGVESVVMLAGLGGVAMPVALHLAGRARQRHILWPAMALLDDTANRARRVRSVRHWVLLLLRCLTVAFVCLAMAGLYWKPAPRSVMVLVDVSGSMSLTDALPFSTGLAVEEASRLRHGLRFSGELLGQLGADDRSMVVTSGQAADPAFVPVWHTTAAQAASTLAGVRPTPGTTDLAACLERALRWAGQVPGGQVVELWVVTDRHTPAWEGLLRGSPLLARMLEQRPVVIHFVVLGEDSVSVEMLVAAGVGQSQMVVRGVAESAAVGEVIAQQEIRRVVVPGAYSGQPVMLVDPQGRVSHFVVGDDFGLTIGPLVDIGEYDLVDVEGGTLLRVRVPPPAGELDTSHLSDAQLMKAIAGVAGATLLENPDTPPVSAWTYIARLAAGEGMSHVLWMTAAAAWALSWWLTGGQRQAEWHADSPAAAGPGVVGAGLRSRRQGVATMLWMARLGVVCAMGALAMAPLVVSRLSSGEGFTVESRPSFPAGETAAVSEVLSDGPLRVWIDRSASMYMPLGPGMPPVPPGAPPQLPSDDAEALFAAAVKLGEISTPPRWQQLSQQLSQVAALSIEASLLEDFAARTRFIRAIGARGSGYGELASRAAAFRRRLTSVDTEMLQQPWDDEAWVRSFARSGSVGTGSGPVLAVSQYAADIRRRRQSLALGEIAANATTAQVVTRLALTSRREFAQRVVGRFGMTTAVSVGEADLVMTDASQTPFVAANKPVLLLGAAVNDAAIAEAYFVEGSITSLPGEEIADYASVAIPQAVARTLWPGEPVSVVVRLRQEGSARINAVRISYRGETIEQPVSFEGASGTLILPLPRLTQPAAAVQLFSQPAGERRVRVSIVCDGEASAADAGFGQAGGEARESAASWSRALGLVRQNNTSVVVARVAARRMRLLAVNAHASPSASEILRLVGGMASISRIDGTSNIQGGLAGSQAASAADVAIVFHGRGWPGDEVVADADSGTAAVAQLLAAGRVNSSGLIVVVDPSASLGVNGGLSLPGANLLSLPGPLPPGWVVAGGGEPGALVSDWVVLPWRSLAIRGIYAAWPQQSIREMMPLLADAQGRSLMLELPPGAGRAGRVILSGIADAEGWSASNKTKLWQAVVRRAAGDPFAIESGGVSMEAPVAIADGSPLRVLVRLRRADGSAETTQRVAPLVIRMDGRVMRQEALAQVSPGVYAATISDLPAGQYTLHFGGDAEPSLPLEVRLPSMRQLSAGTVDGLPELVLTPADLDRLLPAVAQAKARAAGAGLPWFQHPAMFVLMLGLFASDIVLADRLFARFGGGGIGMMGGRWLGRTVRYG